MEKLNSKEVIHLSEHEHGHQSEGHAYGKWHLILMLLCCLIPIAVIVAISFANVGGPSLLFLLVLICPLMMLLMLLPRILPKRT